ncbi:Arabinogalactan peptide 20 [Senna tora]|uniref:Arabinogalactan peptide 20 n=1 Tax=Senna tora TaxID=362788 RepID=A0A834WE58_9FABA|nr:Arabinogalactan peptide 20 [Senna tora]
MEGLLVFRVQILLMAVYAVLGFGVASINAQSLAPAPTSDGIAVDQGIAYVLMLLALLLTYIIH